MIATGVYISFSFLQKASSDIQFAIPVRTVQAFLIAASDAA